MDNTLYMLWCEWDIGQEYYIFSSIESARHWAKGSLRMAGIEESLEEIEDEGLIGYKKVELL